MQFTILSPLKFAGTYLCISFTLSLVFSRVKQNTETEQQKYAFQDKTKLASFRNTVQYAELFTSYLVRGLCFAINSHWAKTALYNHKVYKWNEKFNSYILIEIGMIVSRCGS
jgi:hypothetical protein